jgi:hypothetical protein
MSLSEAEKIEEQFIPGIDTAKVMIKDNFEQHHEKAIDYVNLTDVFDLPLALIVDACEALEREGKIAEID